MLLTPNTLIHDRYLVQRAIGRGGMGAVYEAIDQNLGVAVALKQTLASGTPALDRAFEREARLLATLRHRALPKVTDYFGDEQGQFLVMELIPGDDLAARLGQRETPFPVDEVLGWADQLLEVLAYLHRHQPPVLHRDIKPQNLKVTPAGELILLDFGLAKGAGVMGTTTSVGQSIFAFTPQYASPEQAQALGTDQRSDLYSVAATIYCLLTGAGPAPALTRVTGVVSQQRDPLQPAHLLNPAVSPALSALLMRTLALDPAKRPQTADELRAELRQVDRSVVPPPPSSPQQVVRSNRLWIALSGIALIVLLAAVVGGVLLAQRSAAAPLRPTGTPPATAAAIVATDPTREPTAGGGPTTAAEPSTPAIAVASPTSGEAPTTPAEPSTPTIAVASPTAVPPTVAPEPPTPEAPFPDQQLRDALASAGGSFSVLVYDVGRDQQAYGQGANQVLSAASLIKLPMVLAVYDLAREGQLSLDEPIELLEEDVTGGTGSLGGQPLGTRFSLRELCRRMLAESDNTAGNMVFRRIGFEPVNRLMRQLGARSTQAQRRFLDTAAAAQGRDNLTSAADMLLLLRRLDMAERAGNADAREIVEALKQNIDNGKLTAQLPSGTVVAHKNGTLTGVEHDVGIVYTPSGTYIVVAMSRDLPNNEAGKSAIAAASRVVYNWFAGR